MAAKATARKTYIGDATKEATPALQSQESFLRQLYLEQKRTERSKRPFILMLLEAENLLSVGANKDLLELIVKTLVQSTRETDTTGWYDAGAVIGTIFTEIECLDGHAVAQAILTRCTKALTATLSVEQINEIRISLHIFPEDWDVERRGPTAASSALYPKRDQNRRLHGVKRSIDILGSLAALTFSAPVLVGVAIAVKLTSRGPILFRQKRVGQHGKTFTFLKFRSMYAKNDHKEHETFVKQMIQNTKSATDKKPNTTEIYKIQNDPRITPIGKFLRRTSLDEMPQFINVLLGDMSLVGPRPPIPYEVKYYDIWHRRRLLEVKPGITGLWQVEGRSKVGFNDMVRMDLKYAKSWSILLDLKILLQTPRAVLGGDGAF